MKTSFLRSLILSTLVMFLATSTAEASWWRSFFWTPPPPAPTHPSGGGSSGGGGGGGGGGGSTPAIPEPASMVLMGVGTAAMLYVRQRRRRANTQPAVAEEA